MGSSWKKLVYLQHMQIIQKDLKLTSASNAFNICKYQVVQFQAAPVAGGQGKQTGVSAQERALACSPGSHFPIQKASLSAKGVYLRGLA